MDAERPGKKPASRDSGNKAIRGPFIRKPRPAVLSALTLIIGGELWGLIGPVP